MKLWLRLADRIGTRLAVPLAGLAYLLTAVRVIGWRGFADPALVYWSGWQDQTLYLRSATALSHLDPATAEHYYPLLYPLAGTLFLQAWPSQPFFLVDLACYMLAFVGFRRVAVALQVRPIPALVVFLAATVGQFGFAKLWIEPWTTTPSAALLWLALGATAQFWRTGDVARSRDAIVLGISLALVPFARPGDAAIAAIIAVSAGFALYRVRAGRLAMYAVSAGVIAVALPASLYLAIYGFRPSPYMLYSAGYGFNFGWLGWKAYVLLVDPRAWFGGGVGLLEAAPWLLLGAAGLIAGCWNPVARRPIALTLAAVATLYTVLMLAYVDLLPTGLWRYNNVHYFKWLLPLFGLSAWCLVRDAWRRPASLLTLVPLLLGVTIRLDPVRVAATAPARMVVFPAPRGTDWTSTYLATAWLSDAISEQRNSFDYHQILVGDTVYAVALRRPFAGDERWLGDDRVRAQLTNHDGGGLAPLYLTGPWPKTPLIRYGMKVSFGLPRWFRSTEKPPHS